jgi:hypothetical protein
VRLLALAAAGLALAAPPLTGPFEAIGEPGGTLLVPDGASGRVVRVDPRTGDRTVVASGLGKVTSFDAPYLGRLASNGALSPLP